MKTCPGSNLNSSVRRLETNEEPQHAQHGRLSNQPEKASAMQILRSGKIVDNKVGLDTNFSRDALQEVEEDQGMLQQEDDGRAAVVVARSTEKHRDDIAHEEKREVSE